jgi:glycerophosphoryl diester phosphodiesterase
MSFSNIHHREIYLIAHRCNSTSKVRKALQQGANAIECDLSFSGNEWFVSHDGIKKNDLEEWLSNIRTFKNENLAMIIFDIKSENPIEPLYEIINKKLESDIPRIYSVSKLNHAKIFAPIVKSLKPNEGLCVDEENNPDEVKRYFQQLGVKRCWYGNGITIFPVNDVYHESMKKASVIRDTEGPFSRIYTWTVNRKSAMRKYIVEDGVDGLMVDLNGLFIKPIRKARKLIQSIPGLHLASKRSNPFA